MNIKPKYIPILLFSILAVGIVIGSYLNYPVQRFSFSKSNHKNKLNLLLNFIENDYVDNVNSDSIVDLTVTNILAKLDPHSTYLPANEQVAENEEMQGEFEGIGVNFYTKTVLR